MAIYRQAPPGYDPPGFVPPGFHFLFVTPPPRRFVLPFAARRVILATVRRIAPDRAEPAPPPVT